MSTVTELPSRRKEEWKHPDKEREREEPQRSCNAKRVEHQENGNGEGIKQRSCQEVTGHGVVSTEWGNKTELTSTRTWRKNRMGRRLISRRTSWCSNTLKTNRRSIIFIFRKICRNRDENPSIISQDVYATSILTSIRQHRVAHLAPRRPRHHERRHNGTRVKMQPRDRNPKAAFAIVEKGNISLHRVHYDIDKVNELMIKAGFNDANYKALKKEERYYAGFYKTKLWDKN